MANYNIRLGADALTIAGPASIKVLHCPHEVTALQYTEEFETLMAGFNDGAICAIQKDKAVYSLSDELSSGTFVTGMKHRPISRNYPITNTFVCTYASGALRYWNYNFKECLSTADEHRKTNGIAFHPRNNKFVTFGDNFKIYVYDEDSKRQERVLSSSDEKTSNGHLASVTAACYHPKNVHELISAGLDNTIQYWDTRQPNAVRSISGIFVNGPGLDFMPAGNEFFTCSPDGKSGPTFQLWDYASGGSIQKFQSDKFHSNPLYCGKFLANSLVACGGGSPGYFRIINVNSKKNEVLVTSISNSIKGITIGPAANGPFPEFAFHAGSRIYIVRPGTAKE